MKPSPNAGWESCPTARDQTGPFGSEKGIGRVRRRTDLCVTHLGKAGPMPLPSVHTTELVPQYPKSLFNRANKKTAKLSHHLLPQRGRKGLTQLFAPTLQYLKQGTLLPSHPSALSLDVCVWHGISQLPGDAGVLGAHSPTRASAPIRSRLQCEHIRSVRSQVQHEPSGFRISLLAGCHAYPDSRQQSEVSPSAGPGWSPVCSQQERQRVLLWHQDRDLTPASLPDSAPRCSQ